MGVIDNHNEVSESLHDDDDVLMQLKSGLVVTTTTTTEYQRMEHNSVSSFTGVDSFILDGNDEELRKAIEAAVPSKTIAQRHSSLGSSVHTSALSDSGTDFEYGMSDHGRKSDGIDLTECLKSWDEMLLSNDRTDRLNSSFGDLGKAQSARNLEPPKPMRSQRRMSVCGYTPSESMERRTSFQQTYKATVDDWNSEIPLDSDDEEDPYERYRIKPKATPKKSNSSDKINKNESIRVETQNAVVVNEEARPVVVRKMTKSRSKRILKTNSNDSSCGLDDTSEHTTTSVRSPLRSMLLPRSNRRQSNPSAPPAAAADENDEISIASIRGGIGGKNKSDDNSSISGTIRGIVKGRSFRVK